MDLGKFMGRAQKYLFDNSPVILTGIGVAGVIATAVFTAKATFKAAKVLEENAPALSVADIPTKEKIRLTWQLYIPAAGSAAATIVAILCANKVSTNRAAALASAYTVAQQGFDAYKAKVIDKIGEPKERDIRDAIAQENVTNNPPSQIIMLPGGTVLMRDGWSGRDFRSNMEKIYQAVNKINHQVNNDFSASLGDFYDLIGLEPTSSSEEFGWHPDKLLEIRPTATITTSDEPCIVLNYDVATIRGYHRMS